jgi:hypothetical protein
MSNNPNEIADAAQDELEGILKKLLGMFQEAAQEMCVAAAKKAKAKPSAKTGLSLNL